VAGGGGGGGGEQKSGFGGGANVFGESGAVDVSLNLTALMDILSNLLFFLLASFGATIIMVINGAVPVQSADKSDLADTKQSVTLNVRLMKTGFEINATGSGQTPEELKALGRTLGMKGEKHDYAALTDVLYGIKQKYPKSDTVILTPDPGLRYETLIRTMDAAREREVDAVGIRRPLKLFPTVVVSTVVK